MSIISGVRTFVQTSSISLIHILVPLCVLYIVRTSYFMIYYYTDHIHSDSAVAILLAQEILATGEFFPSGWYPANGELWVLARHVLALPFVYLFGVGHIAYSAMQLLFGAVLFWSAWYAIRPFVESPWQRFVVCSALFIPFSWEFYEHIFGQVSYGPLLAFCLVIIGLLGRALQTDRVWSLHVTIIALLCFATALGSPSRYAAYVLAPSLAGLAVLYLRNSSLRIWGPAVAMLAALPLGFFLNTFVLRGTDFDPDASTLSLDSVLNYPRDIGSIVIKMLEIFRLETVSLFDGGAPHLISETYTYALSGMVLVGGIFLIAHVIAQLRAPAVPGAQGTYETLAVLFVVANFAVIILLLVVMQTDITVRYILPQVVALGFFALAFAFQYHWKSRLFQTLALFIFCVPLLFAATPFRNWASEEKSTQGFADLLDEKGLKLGYVADFWWANKLTLISGGDTVARAVTLASETTVRPYRWLSRRTWYERDDVDPFFLAIPQDSTWRPDALTELGVEVLEVFPFENHLTVYALSGHAAFQRAQPWWLDTAQVHLHAWADTSYANVGAKGEDDRGTYIENDRPGVFVFGPYITLQPGTYTVDMEYSCSADATGEIDFRGGRSGISIDLGPLCSGERDTVSFTINKPIHAAEFRLIVHSGTVRFYRYEGRLTENDI